MNAELVSLPWQVQIALAGGFAGYLLAFSGLREHHDSIEIALYSLIFGLFATAAFGLCRGYVGDVFGGIIGFFVSIILGGIWRKWGRKIYGWSVRKLRISFSNDEPTALAALGATTHADVTQIAVLLDDGTWINCDDTCAFSDAAIDPIIIGPKGDVAMMASSIEEPGKKVKQLTSTRDAYYGDRVTYIPAGKIRRITLRYKKRS